MKHGLPHGIIAACIAGLCACTPAPTAAPTQTVPAAAPIAGPATTSAVAPVTAAADATPPADEATPAAAEAVVRAYYAAINARDFAEAYAQWGDDGAASGQSLENFRNGYAGTRSIEATVGAATAAEGAAGSRFILVPVELLARQSDGGTRRYRGYFVLRAAMVDGASAQQRRWHLEAAEIQRLPDQSSNR